MMLLRNAFSILRTVSRLGRSRRFTLGVTAFLLFSGMPAESREKDTTRFGPPVTLDLVELRGFVRRDMAPELVVEKYPNTNGHLTFEKPIPYLVDGDYFPIDRVIRYIGGKSKAVVGAGVSGQETRERLAVTFLFFRGALKFLVVRHQVLRDDKFEFTRFTTENFLRFVDTGADPGDFFPYGSCIWDYYRLLYQDQNPVLPGECYWDKPGFAAMIAEDATYQERLRNGYESTVDVSTLPKID